MDTLHQVLVCVTTKNDVYQDEWISLTNMALKNNFMVGDIGSSKFVVEQKYDLVIFNQMLWYILENLETAVLTLISCCVQVGTF